MVRKINKQINSAFKKVGREIKDIATSKEVKKMTNDIKKMAIKAAKKASMQAFTGGAEMVQRQVTGMGDYMIRENRGIRRMNPNMSKGMIKGSNSSVPSFGNAQQNSEITFVHREFIMDVYATGSTAFYNVSIPINPGQIQFAPWFSQLASLYDRYRYRGLVFTFVPAVGDSSTTGQVGNVIMAVQYNSAAQPFSSRIQMQQHDGAKSGLISQTLEIGVECDFRLDSGSGWKFIRSTAVPTGQDVKTYDMGEFNIALSGVPSVYAAGSLVGTLFASYVCDLRNAKFYATLGSNIYSDRFDGSNAGSTLTLPFGTNPNKSPNNSIGGTLSHGTASIYTFPDWFQGYVTVYYYATAVTSVTMVTGDMTANAVTSVVLVQDMTVDNGASDSSQQIGPTGAQSRNWIQKTYKVTPALVPATNFITFTLNAQVGGIQGTWLEVTIRNSALGPPSKFVPA